MSLYDQFAMDTDSEVQGVLLDYGDSGRILIARAGGSNKRYQKKIELFAKKYKRQLDLDIMDDKVAEAKLIEIYAQTIVLGWESGPEEKPKKGVIPGPDGKEMQFSYENCICLLTDLPELFAEIRAQSTTLALFREAVKEADAGNS